MSSFKCGVNNCLLAWIIIVLMCDLDLCDECCNFVGMSISSIVDNVKLRT